MKRIFSTFYYISKYTRLYIAHILSNSASCRDGFGYSLTKIDYECSTVFFQTVLNESQSLHVDVQCLSNESYKTKLGSNQKMIQSFKVLHVGISFGSLVIVNPCFFLPTG